MPTEYRADLVIACGEQVRVIVEVQLRRDDDKRWSWPVYVSALRAREQCDVYLLVVTTSAEVASWARVPIPLGRPGSQLEPFVIGPGVFPRITDPEQARRVPELAVLSALLRTGSELDVDAAVAAMIAALGLDSNRAVIYGDLVLRSLGDGAQQVLEALMSASPFEYEFQSEFARKYIKQGRETGLDVGRREATARAIVTILAARGLRITDEQRARITECTSLPTLENWLGRRLSVESVAELLQTS